MAKDYGEILLESMSTLLNAGLQALAKPTSETEEEKKVREEKLLTTTDPFTNFFPNYTKTIVPTIGIIDGTLSEFWSISVNSKNNNLLAVECVISTARIPGVEEPETETEEEVQHVSIPGDFGVMIGVQFNDKTKVYQLTSNDMFGNIYNFKQMPQKIILNLPEDVDIKSIGFTAYNNDTSLNFTLNSITLSLGEDLNALGPTLEPFEISCVEADPKVVIGEDENGELTSLSDTDYHLEARYVGKDANDNYYVVSPNNTTNWPIGLTVRWYKFKAGATASDAWGGAEWEYLTGRDGLTLTCPISELLDEEPDSYKAVLIGFDDTIGKQVNLVSNIVSIDKESLPTEGPITKIGIEFQDGTKGNYPYYDLDNYICPSLMHQTAVKRNAVCKINTPYINQEDGTILPIFFNKINYIEWIYDPKAIQQVDITESTAFECESYFDTNGYSHCRFKNFNNIENAVFDNLCRFTYLIPSRLSVNDIEDKLICKFVFKDGREYEASRTLSFTQRGNNGTNYTVIARLLNEADQVVNVVPIGTEGHFYINVDVYDPEGKHLELIDPTAITIENATYVEDNEKWQLNNAASEDPIVCEISIQFGSESDTDKEVPERIIYLKDYLFIPKCAPTYGDRIYKGPTKIVYNSEGVHPEYNNSFLELLPTDDDDTTSVSWSLNSSITKEEPDFISLNPEITLSAGKYSFTPVGIFDARLENSVMSLEASVNGDVIWKQPIKFIQNKHFSSIIDGWDGSLQIDEDGNYIMASAYVAGGKNDKNEFTGLVMGQLGTITETKETVATAAEGETTEATKPNYKNSHETTPIAKETGLFGYKEGAQSFGFRSDGTAFIGPSGGGRINFDGNGGLIYSGNFDGFKTDDKGQVSIDAGTQGTFLNLVDGQLITSSGIFRGDLAVHSGDLAGWQLDWSGLYRIREQQVDNATIYYHAGLNSDTFVPTLSDRATFGYIVKDGAYYTTITGAPFRTSKASTWRIPQFVDGKPVQELDGTPDWQNLPSLETVQFDKDIERLRIGDNFFNGNKTIRRVYLPKSTYYVGANAFANTDSSLEIYLEGNVGTNWAPGWQGNAKVYYSSSNWISSDFQDIKFVESEKDTKMIRFYAGTNEKAPTMEVWSNLGKNRSVFLVADTGETYISDLEVKRLKGNTQIVNGGIEFFTGEYNIDAQGNKTTPKISKIGYNYLNFASVADIKTAGYLTVQAGGRLSLQGDSENGIRLGDYFLIKDNEIKPFYSNSTAISLGFSNFKLTNETSKKITIPYLEDKMPTIHLVFEGQTASDTVDISLDKTGAYYFKLFMDNIQDVVTYLESNDVIN